MLMDSVGYNKGIMYTDVLKPRLAFGGCDSVSSGPEGSVSLKKASSTSPVLNKSAAPGSNEAASGSVPLDGLS